MTKNIWLDSFQTQSFYKGYGPGGGGGTPLYKLYRYVSLTDLLYWLTWSVFECFTTNCWFSHDVTKIQTKKTIDPTEILLSRCIRAAEN